MHILVKPKASEGDVPVTQEQSELVMRAVDDIVETGKLPDALVVSKARPIGSIQDI